MAGGRRCHAGFSLIVTLSLMLLLSLLAVGLLSLSTLSTRGTSGQLAQAEARANARLALTLALAALQEELGPDQRISATAGILDAKPASSAIDDVAHPHWTGAWNSWGAGRQTFGKDEPSDHRTVQLTPRSRSNSNTGMHPSYEPGRKDHFRRWLVSLDPEAAADLKSARSLQFEGTVRPARDATAVALVAAGSVGPSQESSHVSAPLRSLDPGNGTGAGKRGRFAWWVADESTKARIMADRLLEDEESLGLSDHIARSQGAGSPGHEILEELEKLDDNARLEKVVSHDSIVLAGTGGEEPVKIRRLHHDLTPWSRGLLTDVREGGLKRDLSGLLERPIRLKEPMHRSASDDLLYAFGAEGEEQVPIQDLAAYYQCYREVVKFSNRQSGNSLASGTLQVNNIDFGSRSENPDLGSRYDFTREYTNIYRMPIPVKLQFMLSYIAAPRSRADRQAQPENLDTHKLHIGMTPALTFWNPYNVPLVMNHGTPRSTQLRLFNLPFGMTWSKGRWKSPKPNDLVWITNRNQEGGDRDTGVTLYVGGERPVVFMPGEVRIFSLREDQTASNNELRNSNVWRRNLEAQPGWDPRAYIELTRSERDSNRSTVQIEHPGAGGRLAGGGALTFKAGDRLSLQLEAAASREMANGAALHFFIRQSNTMSGGQEQSEDPAHMRRQYQLTSRLHTDSQTQAGSNKFNEELMRGIFPEGQDRLTLDVPVNTLLSGEPQAFLAVTLAASCETSESNAGAYRGRRTVARPFLHSTPVRAVSFIDRADRAAAYHHGWNWWIEPVNSEDEVGAVSANDRNSFYGGGYTADFGTSFCIQQEVPVTPPQSIAALSHATLSGYSLADRILGANASARTSRRMSSYTDNPFANTTATGGNGLFPRTAQAVGNAYAHPFIPPDQAFTSWTRHFNVTDGPQRVTLADHSYLANKALWDEYFFSSITSREAGQLSRLATKSRDREASKIWDDLPRDARVDAKTLARGFFFKDALLPNTRFSPYRSGLTEDDLDRLVDNQRVNLDGVEELASHLFVEGPFNVNSTSVEAWKAVFAGMRGHEVVVDRSPRGRPSSWPSSHELVETKGTPVSGFSITSGEPWKGTSSDPADPEQWHAWRSLSDGQIDELANAMVEQVKRRGPFLALSEFVNRRLDRDPELAKKGALQAALDDDEVSINAGFRNSDRSFSSDELSSLSEVRFPEALEGPVAYGSIAYADQADLLRQLGGQLTPRGDCFVIRSYGDSVAADGTVLARAWCEAVVQRLPEYVDAGAADLPHASFDLLRSETNRRFGRSLRIVSFRWLSPEEI